MRENCSLLIHNPLVNYENDNFLLHILSTDESLFTNEKVLRDKIRDIDVLITLGNVKKQELRNTTISMFGVELSIDIF